MRVVTQDFGVVSQNQNFWYVKPVVTRGSTVYLNILNLSDITWKSRVISLFVVVEVQTVAYFIDIVCVRVRACMHVYIVNE
jgi:hypothetical protein